MTRISRYFVLVCWLAAAVYVRCTDIACDVVQLKGKCRAGLTCPPSFELEGKKCIKTSFYASQMGCLRGVFDGTDRCVEEAVPTKKCPFGYKNRGDSCTKRVLHHPVKQCPDGATAVKKSCSRKVVRVEACPEGSIPAGGSCITATSLRSYCPEGYFANGEVCTREVFHDMVESCPDDAILRAGWCVTKEQQPAYCADNFFRRRDSCIETAQMKFECPPEFQLTAHECIHRKIHERIAKCLSSFIMDSTTNRCFRETQEPAYCPTAYEMDSNFSNRCVHRRAPRHRCPAGYSDSSEGCVKTITSEKFARCLPGEVMNGLMCEGTVTEAIPQCPQGSQKHGADQCVIVRRADVEYTCGIGFDRVGNECVRDETFQCSKTQMETRCQRKVGHLVSSVEEHHHGPVLHDEHATNVHAHHSNHPGHRRPMTDDSRGGIVSIHTSQSSGSERIDHLIGSPWHRNRHRLLFSDPNDCVEVPTIVVKECHHTRTTPLAATCPKEFVLSDDENVCIHRKIFARPIDRVEKKVARLADMVCPNGVEHDPLCGEPHYAEYIHYCDDPSAYLADDHTCQRETQAKQPKPVLQFMDPIMECVEGEDPDCEVEQVKERIPLCPQGLKAVWNPDGGSLCERLHSLIQPDPMEVTTAPAMVCPPQGCVHQLHTEPEKVCPHGYNYDDSREGVHAETCIKIVARQVEYEEEVHVEAQLLCEPDFEMTKLSKCIKYESAPPIMKCPTLSASLIQNSMNDMVCVEYFEAHRRCKEGDELTEDDPPICMSVTALLPNVVKSSMSCQTECRRK